MAKLSRLIVSIVVLFFTFTSFASANFYLFYGEPTNDNTMKFTVEPGETIQDSFGIFNKNSEPLKVQIDAVDAKTSKVGTLIFKFENEMKLGVGKWLKPETNVATIDPNSHTEIPFILEIPAGTPPGQYAGGIAAKESKEATNQQQTGAVAVFRIVKRVFVDIPGEKIIEYSLDRFEFDRDNKIFTLNISNNGNTLLKGEFKVLVQDTISDKTTELETITATLLPKETNSLEIKWKEPPLFGFFQAGLVADISEFNPISNNSTNIESIKQQIDFFMIPTEFIVVMIIIILSLILLLIFFHIKKAITVKNSKKYLVKENETIISIAEKHNLKWKSIARINKLRKPYIIKKGQTLLIPNTKHASQK